MASLYVTRCRTGNQCRNFSLCLLVRKMFDQGVDLRKTLYVWFVTEHYCVLRLFLVSFGVNDVTGRRRLPAAAEFTTYDVTHIHMYTEDGTGLDTTEIVVI